MRVEAVRIGGRPWPGGVGVPRVPVLRDNHAMGDEQRESAPGRIERMTGAEEWRRLEGRLDRVRDAADADPAGTDEKGRALLRHLGLDE